VRCSSCESSLDAFIEATLDPLRTRAVAVHLRTCAACAQLHRRLRVVDGLLMTAGVRELREDFTARVMSAVGTLPPPQPLRKPFLPLAAFYLVAAWILTAALLAFARPGTPIGATAFTHFVSNRLEMFAQATRALWPIAPMALSAVVGVLAIDALLFAGVVIFYRRVRPRLTAYLTATVEAA
jgi:anti-sigma factor RsiW